MTIFLLEYQKKFQRNVYSWPTFVLCAHFFFGFYPRFSPIPSSEKTLILAKKFLKERVYFLFKVVILAVFSQILLHFFYKLSKLTILFFLLKLRHSIVDSLFLERKVVPVPVSIKSS